MGKDKSTKQAGDDFELLVERHYQGLGYFTRRDVHIDGNQIDIFAEKHVTGGSGYRVIVECKFRTAKLGIKDVNEFLATAKSLIAGRQAHSAILVTNAEITQYAAEAVHLNPHIKIVALSDLTKDIYDLNHTALASKQLYEQLDIYREYVPVPAVSHKAYWLTDDLAGLLVKWAHTSGETLAIVVGDFGSGKSTVLRRSYYEALAAVFLDPQGRFPLFITLGNMLRHEDNLWAFIGAALQKDLRVSLPEEALKLGARRGQYIFFLDGFDEINNSATVQERTQYIKFLSPILTSNCPTILSTRSTYFVSMAELQLQFCEALTQPRMFSRIRDEEIDISALMNSVGVDFPRKFASETFDNFVTVSPLHEKAIRNLISLWEDELFRSTGLSPDAVYERFCSIYEAKDLMSRPILLRMMIHIAIESPEKILRPSTRLGHSELFDIYTQACVVRDYTKWEGSQILTPQKRLQFCQEIAMCMLRFGAQQLNIEQIYNVARDNLRLVSEEDFDELRKEELIEKLVTDIRVCTFLTLDPVAGFKFAHKSYFEFFVARRIISDCEDDINAIIYYDNFSVGREIVDFIADYAVNGIVPIEGILSEMRRGSADILQRSNLLRRVLLSSAPNIDDVVFSGGVVEEVDACDLVVASSSFSEVVFENTSISNSVFSGVDFNACSCSNVVFLASRFFKANLRFVAEALSFVDCSAKDGKLSLRGGAMLERCRVDRCEIVLQGQIALNQLKIGSNSSISIRENSVITFTGLNVFEDSWICMTKYEKWYRNSGALLFRNCVLSGLYLSLGDMVGLTKEDSTAAISSCKGVVFYDNDGSADFNKDILDSIENTCPDIEFIPLKAFLAQSEVLASRVKDKRLWIKELERSSNSFHYIARAQKNIAKHAIYCHPQSLLADLYDVPSSRKS
jgi:hypothetical protein